MSVATRQIFLAGLVMATETAKITKQDGQRSPAPITRGGATPTPATTPATVVNMMRRAIDLYMPMGTTADTWRRQQNVAYKELGEGASLLHDLHEEHGEADGQACKSSGQEEDKPLMLLLQDQ